MNVCRILPLILHIAVLFKTYLSVIEPMGTFGGRHFLDSVAQGGARHAVAVFRQIGAQEVDVPFPHFA